MKQRLVVAIAVLVATGAVVVALPASAASPSCTEGDILCYQPAAETLIQKISAVSEPPIAVPAWLE